MADARNVHADAGREAASGTELGLFDVPSRSEAPREFRRTFTPARRRELWGWPKPIWFRSADEARVALGYARYLRSGWRRHAWVGGLLLVVIALTVVAVADDDVSVIWRPALTLIWIPLALVHQRHRARRIEARATAYLEQRSNVDRPEEATGADKRS